ncbi:LOB domain-containing protein 37-like [Cucurbita pepo subsp. pepo]|uniref:LOB domain-containing protein 37-like n=1 Tax=Cucurbita pepo subsp. pepo TaxID=3664 RepID=UPI000C9D49D8|nr:LOB domain-containing protein 37-like [Cucurbita pepo subsp. pepo]
MSCNGCRVLRKGCSESCILRPCLQWIDTSEAQGHATVFVAKFFGRAGLMSFISAVPESQRPSLFQSLLFEACGRTVNPVNGAVGLLWTGNWHICQAAVETVLRGGTLRPMNEFLAAGSPNPASDETSEAEVACTDMWKLRDSYPNSRFSNSRSRLSPKRKRSEESTKNQLNDLDLRLTPNFPAKSTRRAATPSMNSEESETTTCFESGGLIDHHHRHYHPEELVPERKLLNLFV